MPTNICWRLPMRKVLITGGSGFLGSALARRLLNEGYHVHRLQRSAATPLGEGDHSHQGDLGDSDQLHGLIKECECVLHIASASTPGSSTLRPAAEIEANLRPGLQLIEAMQAFPDRPLVFISSGGTLYGDPQTNEAAEDSPLRPMSYHGASKLALETFLHAYHRQTGGAVSILRPSNLYGPGQTLRSGFGVIRTLLEHLRDGTPMTIWGDGENVRDFLYIDDMVEAVRLAMQHAAGWQVYNVGAGQGHSIHQVRQLAENISGKALVCKFEAARPGDVRRIVLDCTRLRQQLGWQPKTSLEQGIRLTWQWLQSQAH